MSKKSPGLRQWGNSNANTQTHKKPELGALKVLISLEGQVAGEKCPETRLSGPVGVCWAELGLWTPTEDWPDEEEVVGSPRHSLHLLCPPRAWAAFPRSCCWGLPSAGDDEGGEGEAQEEGKAARGSNRCRAGETRKQNLILPLDGDMFPCKPTPQRREAASDRVSGHLLCLSQPSSAS